MWYRLRNDFPLAIITLLGACAAFFIIPLGIYRFASGDSLHGMIDGVVVVGILGAVMHAWRSGNTRVAAWVLVVVATIGCVLVAILRGLPGLFWINVMVLYNFMLLRHKEAALVTAVALVALAIHGGAFDSTLQMVEYLVSTLVVTLFAFIFAYRTEQQRRQLQTLASRDPLTGTANRRSMEEELPLAIEMSRRERKPYALAIMDLDHFKRINDRYGHAAGDQVLIDFVRLVKAATRKGDRLFRYGGEEFVLLLPAADTAALHTILENLRSRVGKSLQSHDEVVTVSIGAATLSPDELWEAWLERADAALYQAKHAGRNRSVVADGAGQNASQGEHHESIALDTDAIDQ